MERRRDPRSRRRQDISCEDETGRRRDEARRARLHRLFHLRTIADVDSETIVSATELPAARVGSPADSPAPWRFALASMPYGAFNGLVAVALPYILRQHGLTVERISAVSATVQVPAIWYFLWAPVVDIKLRRRTWVLLLGVG